MVVLASLLLVIDGLLGLKNTMLEREITDIGVLKYIVGGGLLGGAAVVLGHTRQETLIIFLIAMPAFALTAMENFEKSQALQQLNIRLDEKNKESITLREDLAEENGSASEVRRMQQIIQRDVVPSIIEPGLFDNEASPVLQDGVDVNAPLRDSLLDGFAHLFSMREAQAQSQDQSQDQAQNQTNAPASPSLDCPDHEVFGSGPCAIGRTSGVTVDFRAAERAYGRTVYIALGRFSQKDRAERLAIALKSDKLPQVTVLSGLADRHYVVANEKPLPLPFARYQLDRFEYEAIEETEQLAPEFPALLRAPSKLDGVTIKFVYTRERLQDAGRLAQEAAALGADLRSFNYPFPDRWAQKSENYGRIFYYTKEQCLAAHQLREIARLYGIEEFIPTRSEDSKTVTFQMSVWLNRPKTASETVSFDEGPAQCEAQFD